VIQRLSFLGLIVIMYGCTANKTQQFKNYILGDWRIDTPSAQAFIRFEDKGKTTYFYNRYSYDLDSLAEYGDWKLNRIKKGVETDTFQLVVDRKIGKIVFNFLVVDKNRLKMIDKNGKATYFNRVN
jgi:hypothetical protein